MSGDGHSLIASELLRHTVGDDLARSRVVASSRGTGSGAVFNAIRVSYSYFLWLVTHIRMKHSKMDCQQDPTALDERW
jgi:hypothetical protein